MVYITLFLLIFAALMIFYLFAFAYSDEKASVNSNYITGFFVSITLGIVFGLLLQNILFGIFIGAGGGLSLGSAIHKRSREY